MKSKGFGAKSMEGGIETRQNALVNEYRKFVHYVVAYMVRTMSLPVDLFDEFVAAGNLGLVEAASRYDPESGSDFKSYAFLRIRGAVIDSIRQNSEVSGKAYRFVKALQASHDYRTLPVPQDPAEDREKISETIARGLEYAAAGLFAFRLSLADAEQEISAQAANQTPERSLSRRQEIQLFLQLVETLPEKERTIIEEFYFNDKPFTQIAQEQSGISKSWISRLHARALKLLRQRYLEIVENEGR